MRRVHDDERWWAHGGVLKLASIASRAGKNDIVHGALDANRQGKFLTMAGRCVVEVFIL